MSEKVVTDTRKWIQDVVIGCNFCPFAAREMKNNTVHYEVSEERTTTGVKPIFLRECERLDSDATIETSFIIFPASFTSFTGYLDLVSFAERLLRKHNYEGIYQVASFHPHYLFAGAAADDAANYTNRSPYPMLHLLREASIEKALDRYPEPGKIPERNIEFARQKGTVYMKMLRDACL